jgi:hypothetical protein
LGNRHDIGKGGEMNDTVDESDSRPLIWFKNQKGQYISGQVDQVKALLKLRVCPPWTDTHDTCFAQAVSELNAEREADASKIRMDSADKQKGKGSLNPDK